jgi:DNA-binding NarL/FixJ family response regulator
MDLALPGLSGIEATRTVLARYPATRVLALTMSDDDATVMAAIRAGASGYLLKDASGADIARAVHSVARGEAVFGSGVSGTLLARAAGASVAGEQTAAAFSTLTEREVEILERVARGLSNPAIADELFLSEKTIRNYVSAILTKLHVGTRAEAVARARDAGLGGAPR